MASMTTGSAILEMTSSSRMAPRPQVTMSRKDSWNASTLRRRLYLILLGVSAVFLTGALMRPQWGGELIATPRLGAQMMVCLDVSKSMLAEDVAPNRLERAKAELRDLLPYLEGDQVGLIAFAGRASVICPMTTDYGSSFGDSMIAMVEFLPRVRTPSPVMSTPSR